MSKRMFSLIAALSIASCAIGYAEMLLNDVMSPDVQQKTGVQDLSPKQKMVLETWINDTFVLKTKGPETPKEISNLYLSINVNNGQQLRLSDGTLWDIDPADQTITATWITPFPVKIGQSGNPTYPTLLININNNVSVRAKPAAALAPAPSTPAPAEAVPAPAEPTKPQVVAPPGT